MHLLTADSTASLFVGLPRHGTYTAGVMLVAAADGTAVAATAALVLLLLLLLLPPSRSPTTGSC
jgi:hypothetical protein